MRVVILGDFHLHSDQYDATRSAMEDIANCNPDLVIPLGDFGSQGMIGRIEGLEEAFEFLKQTGAPLRPILGNHDLELESGNGVQAKGTVQRRFMEMFDLDKPYGVLEYDDFRFFFASTEPQMPNSCYDVQECFVSDEQFDWLARKLKERPNVPVVFFTHAPPIGCGLRTVPKVHVRSTNAYLDQNHQPHRWHELVKNTPEIVMWFSAHYHLSHIHTDSHTYRHGTHFFITGVHGPTFTRDGGRQSRILDIDANAVRVLTLDHTKRAITDEGGWEHAGNAKELIAPTEVSLAPVHSCSVGEEPAIRNGIVPLSSKRYLVSTEDGFTWEAEPETESVLGTLHIGAPLKGIAVTPGHVWMAWDRFVGRTDLRSPWRFVRDADGAWPFEKVRFESEATAMAERDSGGIWAAVGTELWSIDDSSGPGKLTIERTAALPESCLQLYAEGTKLWMLAHSGTLYRYDDETRGFVSEHTGVAAWDAWRDQEAAIVKENGDLSIVSTDGCNRYVLPLMGLLPEGDEGNMQIVCLGNHRIVFLIGGQAYFAAVNERILRKFDTAEGRAVAITRSYPDGDAWICSSIAIAMNADNKAKRPKLQVWRIETNRERR